jgi:hypothetical protein
LADAPTTVTSSGDVAGSYEPLSSKTSLLSVSDVTIGGRGGGRTQVLAAGCSQLMIDQAVDENDGLLVGSDE